MSDMDSRELSVERLKAAGEWVQRLNESGEDSTADEWLRWCEADPLNLAAFEEMQRVWDGFGAVEKGLRSTVAGEEAQHAQRAKRTSRLMLLAAGVALAAVAVGWFMSRMESRVLNTSVGELRHISLADGSQIDLAPDSRVSTRLTLTRRDVQLERGQAFFSVAHSRLRPFVVRVSDLSVTTLGTAFDVRTGPNNTVVSVSEGRVSIGSNSPDSLGGPSHESETVRAGVGQRVIFSKLARHLSVGSMDPSGAGAWRNGTLQFIGEPLEDVVSAVNRYSARPLLVSPAFKQARFTGTVSPPSVGEWLEALEQIYDVKVVDQGAHGILIRARAEERAKK